MGIASTRFVGEPSLAATPGGGVCEGVASGVAEDATEPLSTRAAPRRAAPHREVRRVRGIGRLRSCAGPACSRFYGRDAERQSDATATVDERRIVLTDAQRRLGNHATRGPGRVAARLPPRRCLRGGGPRTRARGWSCARR